MVVSLLKTRLASTIRHNTDAEGPSPAGSMLIFPKMASREGATWPSASARLMGLYRTALGKTTTLGWLTTAEEIVHAKIVELRKQKTNVLLCYNKFIGFFHCI